MDLRKSIGFILLAGVVGVLLGGRVIHAQNAVRSADSAPLPKDIYPDIKYNKPTVGLGAKETVIIALGREMFGQRKVSSATFAETLRLFGRRGTVDLVELMALYSATAAELTAFDMQLQEGQKPLLPPQ